MKRSKVFIGLMNTANQAKGFAEALRKVGIKADYWSYSNRKHQFGYPSEKILYLFKDSPPILTVFNKNILHIFNKYCLKILYFIRFLLTYNTFIFVSPSSILWNNYDLSILKLLKKKIIFIFTGCTERNPKFDIGNPQWICNRCLDKDKQEMNFCSNLNLKINQVTRLEKYADYIIAQDDLASFLNGDEFVWYKVFCEKPTQRDYLSKYKNKKLNIIHLPSNQLDKQTHIIAPILEKIAKNKNVEVIIKRDVWSRDEILKTLDNAHILVDQLWFGYSVLGVEAMSRGCVVLNRNDQWFMDKVPASPVYKTTEKTLYNDLVYLINNRQVLLRLASNSMKYYNKYHTPEVLGKYYKSKLELR